MKLSDIPPRVVRFSDEPPAQKTSAAQMRAQNKYYRRNKDVLLAKQRERYWKRKNG